MAFDIYAEGGTDMLLSRAKLLEIMDSLGTSLPEELRHVRRAEPAVEQSEAHAYLGRSTSSSDNWRETVAAGPSHANEHWKPSAGSTEFEAEWARLPPAITALPSFFKIKQLVMRNSSGRSTFQRSLAVLANGIDHCFKSRPAFRHILLDLDNESQEALFDSVEYAGLLPPQPDLVTLSEALWESHFGIPRDLAWYTAPAESPCGVTSCISTRFAPPMPMVLGLARFAIDSPSDVVHCAVVGTKRPLSMVGPGAGLLYAVVQGTLLLVSWPGTDRNFDTWYRLSRSILTNQLDHLDELEDPRINMLRTGDVVYLSAGTINLMIAFTHVCMTSRQVLNPTTKEVSCVIRCCNRLMDACVDKQNLGYSPFDDMEVERMDANMLMWSALFTHLGTHSLHKESDSRLAFYTSTRGSLSLPKPISKAMQVFARGLTQIDQKISRYRTLVEATDNKRSDHGPGCQCSHSRPLQTLNAVARLSSAADEDQATASPPKDSMTDLLRLCARPATSTKGKERAPT
ncbi:hypothetical protein PANT_6d00076 [Moesziomyces antarcticus T-34]|uniref:Uncharacterized protein n=1 Tax=Pseudozyma antarctica (strain T-34) TaxID=1151754 RepID=M9LKX1_PSEA3|nr:hypothetical protein PANT_6d00076 [Moesziomyces antarcticus T-34]